MALGVYVAGDDVALIDDVSTVIARTPGLFLAPTLAHAGVVIAQPGHAPERSESCAWVVLAGAEPITAVRYALSVGADGVVAWPSEREDLHARLGDAVAARSAALPDGTAGKLIAVVGSRGGAGATTIAAHLAAVAGEDVLLLDTSASPAGQRLYASEDAGAVLTSSGATSPGMLRDLSSRHASGARCIYTEPRLQSSPALNAALRGVANVIVVDGAWEGADRTILVVSADVGSVRSAAAMLPDGPGRADIVLNRTRRLGIGAKQIRRTLGALPAAIIDDDPRLRRAAETGRIAKRGRHVRALARLVQP